MINELIDEIEGYKDEIKNLINLLELHKTIDHSVFYDEIELLRDGLNNNDIDDNVIKGQDKIINSLRKAYYTCDRLLDDDVTSLKRQLYVSCGIFLESVVDKFLSVILNYYVTAPPGVRNRLEEAYQKDVTGSAKIDNFKKFYQVIIDCLGEPVFSKAEKDYLKNGKINKSATKIHYIVCYRLELSGYKFSQNILDFCSSKRNGSNTSKGTLSFYECYSTFWGHIIGMRDDISHGNSHNLAMHGGYMCIDAGIFVMKLSDEIISILDLFPKENFKS